LHAQGLLRDTVLSEGVLTVTVAAGRQATAALTLSAQRPADGDGDGVPDVVDNCADAANADQSDADRDGRGDACAPADAGRTDSAVAPDAPEAEDARPATVADAAGGCPAPGCNRPLGAACSANAECASGHCTDGVCCGSADCGGPCHACNRPGSLGSCAVVPPGDPPRAGGCAPEPPATCGRTGKCDGQGNCQRQPVGTLCAAATCRRAREIAASACNAEGECVDGASRACNGRFGCRGDACATTCADNDECNESSYCVQGECRERRPAGSTCADDGECATRFCADERCCLARACAPGAYCGGPGGICINKIFPGSTERCTAGYQCQSGSCVDGKCR
jgi:hypothetical protein